MHCDSSSAETFPGTKSSRHSTPNLFWRTESRGHRSFSICREKKNAHLDFVLQDHSMALIMARTFYRTPSALSTHLEYKYIKINRGTLNIVISNDPLATEPKWYFSNLQIECSTGESVGLRKYQNATAPAKHNC